MARPGKIPFWIKFNFGFGQIGEAAFSAITLTFVSLYYNQALGLNINLVGLNFPATTMRELPSSAFSQYLATLLGPVLVILPGRCKPHTTASSPFTGNAAICYHCMSGLGVCVMSMLADIIDQNTLKTGHVKTAIFYSARGLFSQASRSLATLVGGFAMMDLAEKRLKPV